MGDFGNFTFNVFFNEIVPRFLQFHYKLCTAAFDVDAASTSVTLFIVVSVSTCSVTRQAKNFSRVLKNQLRVEDIRVKINRVVRCCPQRYAMDNFFAASTRSLCGGVIFRRVGAASISPHQGDRQYVDVLQQKQNGGQRETLATTDMSVFSGNADFLVFIIFRKSSILSFSCTFETFGYNFLFFSLNHSHA